MHPLDYILPFTNKISDDVVFQNPWHSQLFAITVQLSETGNFSGKDLFHFFGKFLNESRLELNSLDGKKTYLTGCLSVLKEIEKDIEYQKDINIIKKKK